MLIYTWINKWIITWYNHQFIIKLHLMFFFFVFFFRYIEKSDDIGMSYSKINISLLNAIWINKNEYKESLNIKKILQAQVNNWLRVCKWRLYDDKWTPDNDLRVLVIFPQYGGPFEETAPDNISTTQGRPIKLDEYLCSRYIETLLKPSFIR